MIGEQLEALAQQSWSDDWEVIVADNGSTDGSKEAVARYEGRIPNLLAVDASDREGPRMPGTSACRQPPVTPVVFCDADDKGALGWLAAMGRVLSEHDFVACRLDTETLNPNWTTIHNKFQYDSLGKLEWYPYLPHAGGSSLDI